MPLTPAKKRASLWLSASLLCGLFCGIFLLPKLMPQKSVDTLEDIAVIQSPASQMTADGNRRSSADASSAYCAEATAESPDKRVLSALSADTPTSSDSNERTMSASSTENLTETFSIQVGSFFSYDNAEAMADRMKSRGYRPVMIIPDGASTKVLVGSYNDRRTAALEAEKLQQSGCPAFVRDD
ncbi:MAG: SPOR domain-containing protein [bacterium]|jgi:cell division septation protein DedD|nr:SPOR domain-containing protein [bacterium]MDD4153387.1 SPOR domain-containing protein [bacterium]MDD4558657.1 SPOR domain-containing protein [bacterium]